MGEIPTLDRSRKVGMLIGVDVTTEIWEKFLL